MGKPKLLVIEDNVECIEQLQASLSEDFDLKIAPTGGHALEFIDNFKPFFVLLSSTLPDLNFHEVCSKIKARSELSITKVMILFSEDSVDVRLKAYEMGATDYLIRPFHMDELKAKLHNYLNSYLAESKLDQLTLSISSEIEEEQKENVKSEKFTFLGMHSAEIVHNLKNPLNIAISYTNKLKEQYPKEDNVKKVYLAVDKMSQIVQSVLSSNQPELSSNAKQIQLNDVIQSELELLKADDFYKNNVRTILELKYLPTYKGVSGHFTQVISNLLRNALDALLEADDKILSISTESNKREIKIHITDSGFGIPEEMQEFIFDPLFTTKPGGGDGLLSGSGLGLSFCKKMIEAYNGKLTVNSKENRGSTFTITLPLN